MNYSFFRVRSLFLLEKTRQQQKHDALDKHGRISNDTQKQDDHIRGRQRNHHRIRSKKDHRGHPQEVARRPASVQTSQRSADNYGRLQAAERVRLHAFYSACPIARDHRSGLSHGHCGRQGRVRTARNSGRFHATRITGRDEERIV